MQKLFTSQKRVKAFRKKNMMKDSDLCTSVLSRAPFSSMSQNKLVIGSKSLAEKLAAVTKKVRNGKAKAASKIENQFIYFNCSNMDNLFNNTICNISKFKPDSATPLFLEEQLRAWMPSPTCCSGLMTSSMPINRSLMASNYR